MGKLILLPNRLSQEVPYEAILAPLVGEAIKELHGLIAENEREGRRYLSAFPTRLPPREIPIALLRNKPSHREVAFLLEPMEQGETWGLIVDAGLPCLADPGAALVAYAHKKQIEVVAYPGPSSITQALMLSGFSGQNFAFCGYLGRNRELHLQQLAHLAEKGQTQVFIEAPYRNLPTLQALLKVVPPHLRLCVAWDLTSPQQGVVSQTLAQWKEAPLPDLHRRPAIFLLSSGASSPRLGGPKTGERAGRSPPRSSRRRSR